MLFLVIYAVVTATVAADLECPDARPVDYFNISAYSGEWYEAARYSNGMKFTEKCYRDVCTVKDNKAYLKSTFVYRGTSASLEAVVSHTDATQSGNTTAKMTFSKYGDEFNFEYNSLILLVDYKQYAVVFSCFFDNKLQTNKQLLWIYSRGRTLEENAKSEVENYMKSTGYLDFDQLIWIDNSETACKPATDTYP